MSFTINSERVLASMEKVLETLKVANYDKHVVEHCIYLLFKQIKHSYKTYSVSSQDFYALQAFMNFNKVECNLKVYEYESLINDFIDSRESITNNEEFLTFLQQYFIFFHATQKQEINNFIQEFLSFASKLDGSPLPSLIQTPLVDQEKSKELKSLALHYFNDCKELNFFEVSFHKSGFDRGVILNFHYLESVNLDFVDDYIASIDKIALRLHDFETRYSQFISTKNWNPKRSEVTYILGTNPIAKFSMILDGELLPNRHGKNIKDEFISNYYNGQLRTNKLHCKGFTENHDDPKYVNKLLLASQLHFSFEEYFDFLKDRILQRQSEVV